MSGTEISGIIIVSGIMVGFIIGFLSEGNGNPNTYENIFNAYYKSKIRLREIDLEIMREETKQMTLRLNSSNGE